MNNVVVTNKMDKLTVTAASKYYKKAMNLGSNYAETRLTGIGDITKNSKQKLLMFVK